jgi:flagellar motor switch protein FliG
VSVGKEELTGTQKVAVVLMNMHQDRAAQVMMQFSEAEADEITAEIVRLRRVDADVASQALTEFHEMALQGRMHQRGGREFAVGLLEASFGADKAAGMMNRLASSMAGKSFEFLDVAEPGQIVTLLDGELPQTIALVLAHLRPEHASAVLAGFEDTVRTDVARSIATMGSATPEAVSVVAETLKLRAGAVVAPRGPIEIVGGVQPLVDIINRADVAVERALLEGLDQRDPELAEEVRSRLVTFADIVKLDPLDVQRVVHGIDPSVLALAMKGSSPMVIEAIRMNLSVRKREFLDDEIGKIGPVRTSQVEDARAVIVKSIRELVAEGSIRVQRNEEDYIY